MYMSFVALLVTLIKHEAFAVPDFHRISNCMSKFKKMFQQIFSNIDFNFFVQHSTSPRFSVLSQHCNPNYVMHLIVTYTSKWLAIVELFTA